MSQYEDMNRDLSTCLSAVAAGDPAAFETLYKLTAPKLTAIIMGMMRDEALTYDILQQAYMSVWKNAGKYDPEKGKAFTWMLVITRNKALDTIRKRKRFSLSEEIPENLPDETMESDKQAKALLLRRLIAPHMATLSSDMRDAIILSAIYGMSSREIGEKFGVPTNTAKSWVRRGLEKLRSEMNISDLDSIL